jgi:hypothetical protein
VPVLADDLQPTPGVPSDRPEDDLQDHGWHFVARIDY